MRAMLSVVAVGLVGATPPQTPVRYLVIPTGHAVDGGVRPCAPSLSTDGAVVAFDAHASLDPVDQNGRPDVYLLDRATTRVTLVSRALAGGTGRGLSRCPRVSGDGQRVVFESDVTDLVEDDTPGTNDVFVFERSTGAMRRIAPPASAGPTMSAHPVVSTDGRLAAFDASAVGATHGERRRVYRAIVDTGVVEDLGEGHSPAMSGDGRVVAFVTSGRPGQPQVIRIAGPQETRTLGRPDAGGDASAPVLSADGQWIAYVSRQRPASGGRQQPGLAQVYVERIDGGARHTVSVTHHGGEGNGMSTMPAIDATGASIVFASTATNLGCGTPVGADCDRDINLLADLFLWDRATGTVTRVNAVTPELPWLEGGAFPAISHDGRAIAFLSRQPVSADDGRDTFDLFVTRR